MSFDLYKYDFAKYMYQIRIVVQKKMKLLFVPGKKRTSASLAVMRFAGKYFFNFYISGLINAISFGVTNPLPVMGDLKQFSNVGNPFAFAVYNKRSPIMTRHLKTLWKPKVYQLKKRNDDHHFWGEIEKLFFGINDQEVEY